MAGIVARCLVGAILGLGTALVVGCETGAMPAGISGADGSSSPSGTAGTDGSIGGGPTDPGSHGTAGGDAGSDGGADSSDLANPAPPPPGDAIGDAEIIAGDGEFEGQPFNTLPNPHAARAALAYSPFGDAFGLSLVQMDETNPSTGDFVALVAGLHASRVERREGLIIGYVTPSGGLSGPSLFNDGGLNKPVSGVMFLRKLGREWVVDVYCIFQGGSILGQARGAL